MPLEETTPAIVLRARDYAESDRIVTLLTLHAGKLSGIAKGAKASRHRFERKLEPFSHVVLHFRRRPHGQLVFITRAEAADLTQHVLDDDLAKIALGSYMLELTDALTTEESEAAEAYRVLSDGLGALSTRFADAALRQAFEMRLLGWAGFGLEFTRCRICATLNGNNGAATAVYFVVSRGGIVCAKCRPSLPEAAIKMTSRAATILARLGVLPMSDSPGSEAAGPDGALALARFIGSIIDRRLRSQEFLDSILPGAGKA
ncbi:DNA repair protein RecO [Candidatus Binatus sp.]|uniref:DNA repair protein RecO n=1 Tax=Candidatus Binatus sp. TaxID=2811406 RepID=UPI003BB1CD5E